MMEKSAIEFCNDCPRNHFGVCPSMLRVLTQESEFHAPKQISLRTKHYLYHQGEQLNEIYILQKGWMLLTKNTEQGKRQIIRSVLPGDLLGFQPDLQAPAIYSAIALLDSVVCSIPDFMTMCSLHPELALKLVWAEASETTLAESYMTNIAHHDALEKIAFMALELFQRLKIRDLNNGYTVPFPLTQEDIADTLGLTITHVNRTLHKLRDEKILTLHKHELTILDYEKLSTVVGQQLKSLKTCNILN